MIDHLFEFILYISSALIGAGVIALLGRFIYGEYYLVNPFEIMVLLEFSYLELMLMKKL